MDLQSAFRDTTVVPSNVKKADNYYQRNKEEAYRGEPLT
jgi:hypothetical protein